MRRAFAMLAVMMAMVIGAAAAAAEASPPKQLNPTTAWRLDYGDERCSLAQQYGSEGDAVLFEIDSFGAKEEFWVTLSGKAIPFATGPMKTVAVRFPGDPTAREIRGLAGTTDKRVAAVSFPLRFVPYEEYKRHLKASEAEQDQREQPDRAFADYERTISAIVVGLRSGSVIQLNVADVAKPLAALRACVDNLIASWGIDPAVQDSLSRPAKPDIADVRKVQARYPPTMLRNGMNALVSVRLMVDAGGTATSCVVQTPTADRDLQRNICSSLRHFRPALDASGKPVASVYTTTVIFRVY